MSAKEGLGFEITELRLGLPGASQLPTPMEIKKTIEVKKRVFADINEDEENNSTITDDRKRKQIKATQVVGWPPVCSYRKKNNNSSKSDHDKQRAFSNIVAGEEKSSSTVTEDYPRKVQNKATNQVVGWPPVCSYRKKSSANAVVNNSTATSNIKISMDGAPYLRKIALNVYEGYSELAIAFEKLFGCFGTGQDSEYISIYEDKDGDWMLVGDGPYKMFTESCKRLRIMKRSEAKGFGLTL